MAPRTTTSRCNCASAGVEQVILAGMSANLCTESAHARASGTGIRGRGRQDGTAAAMLPEGDGYLAAIINFRYMANAVWTTDEVVAMLG